MKIKQISVFVENKEGRIKSVLEALSSENINIRALSIADSEKSGIIRLIVDDSEKAKKALENHKFITKETEVIVVGVPDEPNGLNNTLAILENKNINVEYIYAFVSHKKDEAIVVMKLDKPEEGLKALEDKNITILSQEDIENI